MKSLLKSKVHLAGFMVLLIVAMVIWQKDTFLSVIGEYQGLEAENEWRRTELYQATYDTTLATFIGWQGMCETPLRFLREYGGTTEETVLAVRYGYSAAQLPEIKGQGDTFEIKRLALHDAVRDFYMAAYAWNWQDSAKAEAAYLDSIYALPQKLEMAQQFLNEKSVGSCEISPENPGQFVIPVNAVQAGLRFEVDGYVYDVPPYLRMVGDSLWEITSQDETGLLGDVRVNVFIDSSASDYPFPTLPIGWLTINPCP